MEIVQASVLGLIQGLTEFLPISSSGHLIIVPAALGWENFTNNITFDVALHTGTALAVLFFFREDWIRILKAFSTNLTDPKKVLTDFDSKLLVMIAVGSVPAAFVGLLFQDFIVEQIRQPRVVAVTLILFAALLFFAERVGAKHRKFTDLSFKDAILVGLVQALALVPGVSRSGITITASLFRGVEREAAARFSFMLATPVIFGAGILRVKDAVEVGFENLGWDVFFIGVLTSGVVGWFAIKYLLKYVLTHDYNVFVWYRVLVGVAALLLFF